LSKLPIKDANFHFLFDLLTLDSVSLVLLPLIFLAEDVCCDNRGRFRRRRRRRRRRRHRRSAWLKKAKSSASQ